jgi:Txe/YoeB family toxin of Txe-Axe toxin-antitoxin module
MLMFNFFEILAKKHNKVVIKQPKRNPLEKSQKNEKMEKSQECYFTRTKNAI